MAHELCFHIENAEQRELTNPGSSTKKQTNLVNCELDGIEWDLPDELLLSPDKKPLNSVGPDDGEQRLQSVSALLPDLAKDGQGSWG